MLSPSVRVANRSQTRMFVGVALDFGGVSLLWLAFVGALAAINPSAADSPHKVGLADSRVGYEYSTYATDSKGVI